MDAWMAASASGVLGWTVEGGASAPPQAAAATDAPAAGAAAEGAVFLVDVPYRASAETWWVCGRGWGGVEGRETKRVCWSSAPPDQKPSRPSLQPPEPLSPAQHAAATTSVIAHSPHHQKNPHRLAARARGGARARPRHRHRRGGRGGRGRRPGWRRWCPLCVNESAVVGVCVCVVLRSAREEEEARRVVCVSGSKSAS